MFINKDDKEKIELLNELLGMSHRTKSYDMLNPDDLIELTELITAEYIDMRHYWNMISRVHSDFDESVEVFYPARWMNITLQGSTGDDEIDEVIGSLIRAEDSMDVLVDRAEEKCVNLWRFILNSNFTEVKKHFFKEDITVDQEIMGFALGDGLVDLFEDLHYTGNVQQSTKEFARYLLNQFEIP